MKRIVITIRGSTKLIGRFSKLFLFYIFQKTKAQTISPYLTGLDAWVSAWFGRNKSNPLENKRIDKHQLIRIDDNMVLIDCTFK
jgi:hypothetical protein